MIRFEKDHTLPPGTAQAFDSDGTLLATIKPPNDRVPPGTAIVRVSAEEYGRMIVALDDVAG